MNYDHGGDWYSYLEQYGKEPIDFSANISPLGLPGGVRKAVTESLAHAGRYPDPYCRKLCEAIGQAFSLPTEQILCGNGAADLIYRIMGVVRPRRLLLTDPTFSEYEKAARQVLFPETIEEQAKALTVSHYPLSAENGFCIREDFLEWITEDTDLVCLAEPGNPTGLTTDPQLLKKIVQKCVACDCRILIDRCFADFLDTDAKYLEKILLTIGGSKVIILRAFTKTYAMAGIRLGYLFSRDEKLLDQLAQAAQPWAVSGPAQVAGIAALEDETYLKRVRSQIRMERRFLLRKLKKLGFEVIPGEANYLFFHVSLTDLSERLKEEGFLIRSFPGNERLSGWYRIAVRRRRDNRLLIKKLEELVLKEKTHE